MAETIEVRYRPVQQPSGGIYYHKYFVYTNSNGEQYGASASPERNSSVEPLGLANEGLGEAFQWSPFGNITTEVAAYKPAYLPFEPGFSDFDPTDTDSRETVKTGGDLSSDWTKIVEAMGDIRDEKYIYRPITQNSNTVVDEALRRAGVPLPQNDDPGENEAPGSGNVLNRKNIWDKIKDAVKKAWDDAQHWFPRHDPLTLDLDNDGLETTGVAATNPILFDHDGDGIKNGTGWVNADDGFLVRDVNGNGTIDSGRELFGDNTIKSNGQLATDGFDALVDLDSIANGGNADGRISNADAQFTNLRIWRDLNQDGISQSNELFTLNSQNIASINVTKTANSQTLPNGNQIADLGTFTRTDGSTGIAGAVTGNLADVNLASDTFHRTFPDVLDTTSVATLPDMQGSGKVRDLREAATQSTTLQSLLTQYSATTTRASQIALIDQLLDAWADTGGMAESLAQRVAGMTGYTRADGVVIPYTLSSNLTAAWIQKLHIIETFNGSYFFGLPGTTQTAGAVTGLTIATPTATSTSVQITANFNQQQLDLLQQSYDAIKGSVYDALVIQTRFKPLLDQINLVIDANGISLDFSQLEASFNTQIANNAEAGLLELIDFNYATQNMLAGASWQGWHQMASKLETTQTTAVNDALKLHGARAGDSAANSMSGSNGDDTVFALAGNDYIVGRLSRYTKCTSTRLPKAAAYLRNVSMLGECFPEASALSSLATAGALVPIRAATSACDKPAARLAASISSNMANSSRFKRSYSARTAGLSSILAFSSACVNNDSAFMFNLLHSCFSQSQFTRWRSLRFFNKTMQHHNTLPNQSAIKHTGNTLNTFKPQFKQAITKSLGMWFAQVSAIYLHAVSQSKVAATQTFWQSQNICLYGIAVINDGVLHDINSNKYVTNKQAFTKIVAANDWEWRVRA